MVKKFLFSTLLMALIMLPLAFNYVYGDDFGPKYDYTSAKTLTPGTQIIHIHSEYDEYGHLIGQTQTITGHFEDLDGNDVYMVTEMTYKIIDGKAKLAQVVSHTLAEGDDGSWQEITRTVNYEYDDNGVLMGASGEETVIGETAAYYDEETDTEIPAERYEGHYTLTYEIKNGEALLVGRSGSTTYERYNEEEEEWEVNRTVETTTTYAYDFIAGSYRMVSSTAITDTTYTETDKKESEGGKHLFSHTEITTTYEYGEGGYLVKVHGSGTGYGYAKNPSTGQYENYTSEITVEYEIINGAARQTDYTEVRHFAPKTSHYYDPKSTGTLAIENGLIVLITDTEITAYGPGFDADRDGKYELKESILTYVDDEGKYHYALAVSNLSQEELATLFEAAKEGKEVTITWSYFTENYETEDNYGWLFVDNFEIL